MQKKHVTVSAAVIHRTVPGASADSATEQIFATQRGYGEFKDWWEFPGGKIEAGETPEEALVREIREELETEIIIGQKIETVEYDYPKFHLTMHCFWCVLLPDTELTLKEHEAAHWLAKEELNTVKWLPADEILLPALARFY